MGQIVKHVRLENTSGVHNKAYEIQIERANPSDGGGYLVNFSYGKIGKPPVSGTKTEMSVSQYEAHEIFDKLRYQKIKKGYKEVTQSKPLKLKLIQLAPGVITQDKYYNPTKTVKKKTVKKKTAKKKPKKKSGDDEPKRSIIV